MTREWVKTCEALAILEVSDPRQVRKLAKRGLIRTRQLPGTHPTYSVADCQRLAQEAIQQPATAQ